MSRHVERLIEAVKNHNVESVPRLYYCVRPQARYQRSLEKVLHHPRRMLAAGGKAVARSL